MNSRKISRFFVYFFLTVGALVMLLPFFWMFSSAFKTTQEINRFPPQWLPSHLGLENFKRAFEMAPFGRYFVRIGDDVHDDSGRVCVFPPALSGQEPDFFSPAVADDDSV